MIGKRISFKIGLILRKIMKQKGNIHYTDVESANALRKLRAVMKLDAAGFASSLGIPEEALNVLEGLGARIPSYLLVKAAGQAGINASDMADRLDKVMDKAGCDYNDLAPDHIPASEIFDLIYLYGLVLRENERLNILRMLRMLACDRSETKPLCKAGL